MEIVTTNVEVPTVEKMANPDAVMQGFSGEPGDFAADIAKIAQELGQAAPGQAPALIQEQVAPVEASAQPQASTQGQAQAAEQPPVAVPQKFQDKDGQLDGQKLAKSTQDAEAALRRYREIEADLKRKQNDVRRMQAGIGQPPQQQAQPQQGTFEAEVEADIQRHGMGKTLAKLFDAARQSAYDQARSDLEGVAGEIEWGKRQRELENIGRTDPWVFSDDGIKTLGNILDQRPWLQASPSKWSDAYDVHLAQKQRQQMSGSQVQTPTPTAPAARAPAPPAGAANRVNPSPSIPDGSDTAALNAWLDKQPEAVQKAYWQQKMPWVRKI